MSGVDVARKLLDGVTVGWTPLDELGELVYGNGLPESRLAQTGAVRSHDGQGHPDLGAPSSRRTGSDRANGAGDPKQGGTAAAAGSGEREDREEAFPTPICLADARSTDACKPIAFRPASKILGKYVAHFTHTKAFERSKWKCAKRWGGEYISSYEVTKIRIPIPYPEDREMSLATLTEVVRILDAFTRLDAERDAELGARRTQYVYFRERMFSFEESDDVRTLPLGELGSFTSGGDLQEKDLAEEGFPAMRFVQILKRHEIAAADSPSKVPADLAEGLQKAREGDLLFAAISASDDKVAKPLAWLGDEIAVCGGVIIFRHKQNARYLAHFAQTEAFRRQKQKYIAGTWMRRISSAGLAEIRVPIPCHGDAGRSLAEQSRIADALDKFHALMSPSEGLPREIALRKKEYAYHCDSILSLLGSGEGLE